MSTVCQDPPDSLFECPDVVYVGIPHGHQLLRVVVAVLHNAHSGLPGLKLLERNRSYLGPGTSRGPGGLRNLLIVSCSMSSRWALLLLLGCTTYSRQEPLQKQMQVGPSETRPKTRFPISVVSTQATGYAGWLGIELFFFFFNKNKKQQTNKNKQTCFFS